jgi:hypothetical protein
MLMTVAASVHSKEDTSLAATGYANITSCLIRLQYIIHAYLPCTNRDCTDLRGEPSYLANPLPLGLEIQGLQGGRADVGL